MDNQLLDNGRMRYWLEWTREDGQTFDCAAEVRDLSMAIFIAQSINNGAKQFGRTGTNLANQVSIFDQQKQEYVTIT